MKCIIVEDQPPAQRILKKYISDLGSLELVGTFTDPIQVMEFLKKEHVDLIFLDIHLPKISGIEFLKSTQLAPKVILTTAFSEFAIESYEHSVVDYLLKPFSFARFVKAVNKLSNSNSVDTGISKIKEESKDFFIKVGYEFVKISTDAIDFVKADGDYTEIHSSSKKHLTQDSLKQWEEKLDGLAFTRIHKSYIINLDKIEKIASGRVELKNSVKIPIGRSYKESFEAKVLGK